MNWKKQRQPNAMTVEFGFFHHDDLLCRATIRIEEREKSEEFDSGTSDGAPPAGHLVIRHWLEFPSASLHLALVRCPTADAAPEVILEAGLAMGVHDSDDWESVALGGAYTLAFLCRQEF